MTGILTGLRVLDLSRMPSGPHCTRMLADLGAEVIRVDAAARNGAGGSVSRSRSTKSVQLDLETDEGRAALRALAATADVVVDDFRPGVLERPGLSYESLAAANPRLVHAPMPAGAVPGIGDALAGSLMAFGILAALRAVEATGQGQVVDMAAHDALVPPGEGAAGGDGDGTAAMPARPGASDADAPTAASAPAPDPRALRNAFGAFATGVTVLTARQDDGTPRGFTANSFTSVSLDPPLLLVCLAKTAHSCATFMTAGHFAVNVLAEEQKAVSGLFASRVPDKFDQCDWRPGAGDVPLIDGALAQFACARERLVDAGDHIVLIGRVIDFATAEGNPLGYFRGSYFSIGLEDRLVSAVSATGGTRIGAVLTDAGRLLLCEAADGALSVPAAPGAVPNLQALRRDLTARGLKPEVEFLYAVYEDSETGINGIFYHGQVSGPVPAGMVLIPLDAVPWDRVASAAERAMLQRYAEEFRHGAFGIYQGNETTGKVRRVTEG